LSASAGAHLGELLLLEIGQHETPPGRAITRSITAL